MMWPGLPGKGVSPAGMRGCTVRRPWRWNPRVSHGLVAGLVLLFPGPAPVPTRVSRGR